MLHAKVHVHQPKARNASYLSPSSQKDIISDIGNDLIQAKLITESRRLHRFFSIFSGEVASHNQGFRKVG